MQENHTYETVKALLASNDAEKLHEGLEVIRQAIARKGVQEARQCFELLTELFYIDTLDNPELAPILNEAISLVVGFGEWVIPHLISKLDEGDIKAQMAIGQALGRIGADAIQPLLEAYRVSKNIGQKTFILYALGKIKSPKIVVAAEIVLEAASSTDCEMLDTATRAIGKLAESMAPADLPPEIRQGLIDQLYANLSEINPVVRSKAVRSLGKLARFGFMNEAERQKLKSVCESLLGEDKDFDWDRAYIVRYQAQEALQYL
ncbi:MAG: hypothetical protein JXA13_16390 [Anaerolineales bacterium]|nr:hypothetical protein [Anaerolineales bacterium]